MSILLFLKSTTLRRTVLCIILLFTPRTSIQQCTLNELSGLLEIKCVKMTSATFAESTKDLSPYYYNEQPQYHLDISNSNLTVLKNDSFKLRYSEIIISDTTLQTIEPKVFNTQPKLEHLNLANNNINTISSDFKNCYNLKRLNLSSNCIVQLQYGVFPRYLKLLDLSNNKIESVETAIFAEMTDLNLLDLSRNNLNRMDGGGISPGLFMPLSGLRYLNISHNSLSVLFPGTFAFLKALISLDLGNNNLSHLPVSEFSFLNLTYLHIDHNMLSDLDGFLNNKRKTIVYMDDNNWDCEDLFKIIHFKLSKEIQVMNGTHFQDPNVNGLKCKYYNPKYDRTNSDDDMILQFGYSNRLLENLNNMLTKYIKSKRNRYGNYDDEF